MNSTPDDIINALRREGFEHIPEGFKKNKLVLPYKLLQEKYDPSDLGKYSFMAQNNFEIGQLGNDWVIKNEILVASFDSFIKIGAQFLLDPYFKTATSIPNKNDFIVESFDRSEEPPVPQTH